MPEVRQRHRRYMKGEISPAGAALGADTIAAMREAIGPDVEILIDAHGNFNVPTAIRMARRLESYDIGWFEEYIHHGPQRRADVETLVDAQTGLAEAGEASPAGSVPWGLLTGVLQLSPPGTLFGVDYRALSHKLSLSYNNNTHIYP